MKSFTSIVVLLFISFQVQSQTIHQNSLLEDLSGFSPAPIGTFQIKTKDNSFLRFLEAYTSNNHSSYLLTYISKYRPTQNDTTIILNNNASLIIFSTNRINSQTFSPLDINHTFIKE